MNKKVSLVSFDLENVMDRAKQLSSLVYALSVYSQHEDDTGVIQDSLELVELMLYQQQMELARIIEKGGVTV